MKIRTREVARDFSLNTGIRSEVDEDVLFKRSAHAPPLSTRNGDSFGHTQNLRFDTNVKQFVQ